MRTNITKGLMLAASTVLLLSSCTVSEPKAPSGAASELRLTGLKSYGMDIVAFDYDGQNRITTINYANDLIIEFSYEGTSKVPVQVVTKEYDYSYNSVTDTEERHISETDTWTNIQSNSAGYITSYESTEERYDNIEKSRFSCTYDSNGHLLSSREVDQQGNALTTTYEWDNGLLMSYSDNDTSHQESGKYTYSDVENVNLQWDPNTQAFGPIAVTGLFGKAPSKFLKSEETFYNGYRNEYVQYSYALLENGLINMAKVGSYYDETIVYNFVYESVK